MTGFEPILVQQDWNADPHRDWTEVLERSPLFSELGKRDLRKIVRHGQFADFAPGEAVVLTGGPADSFFVVLDGRAEVRAGPHARVLAVGDHFGEIGLLGDGSRSATVVATEALHVMRLPGRVFLKLVEENTGVALTLLRELGDRLGHPAAAVPDMSS